MPVPSRANISDRKPRKLKQTRSSSKVVKGVGYLRCDTPVFISPVRSCDLSLEAREGRDAMLKAPWVGDVF